VNRSHVTTPLELGQPCDHDHEQCSTSDVVPKISLEDSNGFHIQVVEAFGEKRNRKGRRRLLFWTKTEHGMHQIDPLYPANVSPIGYEGLSLSTLPETEELDLRLMRFQKKYDNCGKTKTGKVKGTACRNHIKETVRIFPCCCHRPGCEVCGDPWAWRVADRVLERVMGCRTAYVQEGFDFPFYDHVVFSVPLDQYQYYIDMIKSTATYPKLRVEMRKIAKLAGVTAAAEWFHPYRFKHVDGSNCEIKDCPEKHYTQWSPHWHMISTGYLMNSDDFYKKTGWVYKKIQKQMSPRKVKLVAHYQSTHCGLMVGKESKKIRHNVVTYSGLISSSKVRVKHRKELVTEKCDIENCDRPKEYFLGDIPPLGEPFTQDHIRRWDGVVEYLTDTRIYYLPITLKAMEDIRGMNDHG